MGVLQHVAVVLFNLSLILLTLPPYVVALVAVTTAKCRPLAANSFRRRAVLATTCLAWRMLFLLCCWVRIRVDGLYALRSGLGATGRPAIIIANHSSFMDTILLVTFMPVSKIVDMKMMVSSHLLKMPVLGTIVAAMGHKAVPFKSGGPSGTFEVDKELMAVRQKELQDHVAAGGLAGWFPEGTINKGDIREVKTFRAGGFTLAVHVDVEIWCVAFQGNTACWPATAAVGGRPAKIGVKIFKLCDSSHSLILNSNIDLSDDRAASLQLANCAHGKVQLLVDQLAKEGYVTYPARDEATRPLLQGT